MAKLKNETDAVLKQKSIAQFKQEHDKGYGYCNCLIERRAGENGLYDYNIIEKQYEVVSTADLEMWWADLTEEARELYSKEPFNHTEETYNAERREHSANHPYLTCFKEGDTDAEDTFIPNNGDPIVTHVFKYIDSSEYTNKELRELAQDQKLTYLYDGQFFSRTIAEQIVAKCKELDAIAVKEQVVGTVDGHFGNSFNAWYYTMKDQSELGYEDSVEAQFT